MADEPDDIEPDLLRERLLMLAEHGEITGKQAEAAAAAHGLEPFERKPELPCFDPKLKSHWSVMMVVAWIAWRDFELVILNSVRHVFIGSVACGKYARRMTASPSCAWYILWRRAARILISLSKGATGRIGSTSQVVRSPGLIICSNESISALSATEGADRSSSSTWDPIPATALIMSTRGTCCRCLFYRHGRLISGYRSKSWKTNSSLMWIKAQVRQRTAILIGEH